MSGKIKKLLDDIIRERGKGNSAIEEMTKAKLILKGLNPNNFNQFSEDDATILEKVYSIAEQFHLKNLLKPEKNINAHFSEKSTEAEIVADFVMQFKGTNIKILIFFAAPKYDLDVLSHMLNEAFQNACVFGSSTAGEIVSGRMLKNSVVAMTIDDQIIEDVQVAVVQNMSKGINVEEAFATFETHYNQSAYRMDPSQYVGLILVDGISRKEEQIMDLIGDRTDVIFIGGSAGDNRAFLKTYVCADGQAYTDAAVLVLMKMNEEATFGIIKTQSFEALNTKLVATKVNGSSREVIEFDHMPAAYAYAKAVGASTFEEVPNYFMTHPVGLFVGEDEFFIRSPQQLKGTSMLFYCNILEGMTVNLLTSTDMIVDTKKTIELKLNEWDRIDGLINFHCVERTQELERKNQVQQYGELFSDIPTIGFSTYGEEYIGHINQTSTMLAFKRLEPKVNSQEKEMEDITSGLIEFNVFLEEEINKRTQREAEVTYISYHDQLTGLYNRRYFEEEILRLDTPENLPISIIMGDVNSLKVINDAFGHSKGDELLCKSAIAIQLACENKHLVARIGGDEFAIALMKHSKEEAQELVMKIKELYANEQINGLSVSVSFGWDTKETEEISIKQIIRSAENDMYKNKTIENKGVRGSTIQVILKNLNEKYATEERHTRRVSHICQAFGQALGYSEFEVAMLKQIGLMHDIGKIAVEEGILCKPGPLTSLERNEVRRHPDIGYRILSASYDLLEIATYVLAHHERWDGEGYPKGLKGEEIPKISRIITIADAYEAMTSERPFRQAMSKEAAYEEILKQAGSQFDPELAQFFVNKVVLEEE